MSKFQKRPHYEEVASEINETAMGWLRASGRFPAFFVLEDRFNEMCKGDKPDPAAVSLLEEIEAFVADQPDGPGLPTMRVMTLYHREDLRFYELLRPRWRPGDPSLVVGEIARAADADWRVLGEECGYAGLTEVEETSYPPQVVLNRAQRRKEKRLASRRRP